MLSSNISTIPLPCGLLQGSGGGLVIMKKQILLLTFLFGLFLTGGCVNMSNGEQSVRDAALSHLEQKYGGSFEFVSPFGASHVSPGVTEMLFKRQSSTDNILVSVNRENNDLEIRDNYLAVIYRQETTDFIKSIADELFVASVVFYEVTMFTLSPELTAESTFEEYITHIDSSIDAVVAVSSEGFNEQMVEAFAKRFQEKNIRATFNFVAIGSELLATITHPAVDTIIAQGGFDYFAVILVDGDGITINPREVR
jgi:hypothetical protein